MGLLILFSSFPPHWHSGRENHPPPLPRPLSPPLSKPGPSTNQRPNHGLDFADLPHFRFCETCHCLSAHLKPFIFFLLLGKNSKIRNFKTGKKIWERYLLYVRGNFSVLKSASCQRVPFNICESTVRPFGKSLCAFSLFFSHLRRKLGGKGAFIFHGFLLDPDQIAFRGLTKIEKKGYTAAISILFLCLIFRSSPLHGFPELFWNREWSLSNH